MSNLFAALLLVVGINVMFMIGQASVLEVNPSSQLFYHGEGNTLCQFDTGNCANSTYQLNDQTGTSQLPSGTASVSPTTGNVFTDGYTTLKSYFSTVGTGLSYFLTLLTGPYYFLSIIGLPSVLTFVFGSMWYALTLFLIIAFTIGRGD